MFHFRWFRIYLCTLQCTPCNFTEQFIILFSLRQNICIQILWNKHTETMKHNIFLSLRVNACHTTRAAVSILTRETFTTRHFRRCFIFDTSAYSFKYNTKHIGERFYLFVNRHMFVEVDGYFVQWKSIIFIKQFSRWD